MLKFTNVELELLNDYKYVFIKTSIRGGIPNCIRRRAEANNPNLYSYDNKLSKS